MTLNWYPLPDPADAAHHVTEAFRQRFGREPDGVWAAPGRVNVIGEHVDYNAGLCLPFALPHRTFVALASRDDGGLRVRSGQDKRGWHGHIGDISPGSVKGWAGYAVGVPWALRQSGFEMTGFDAFVEGYVPLGSGLSSSAALECAIAIAVNDVAGSGLGSSDAGRAQLAAACVRAENEIAGAPTGGLDQTASLRCAAGHALLLDCQDFSIEQVPFDLATVGLELLVTDTRAHHAHADGQYGLRRQTCHDAARALGVDSLRQVDPAALDETLDRLATSVDDPAQIDEVRRRVRHVVTEIARVEEFAALLQAGKVCESGPLLDASHASLRDDYEVSCIELDLACKAALGAGALGARMTGGGFGGSAIALVEAAAAESVAHAIADAFAGKGLPAPGFLRAAPSAPAGRVC